MARPLLVLVGGVAVTLLAVLLLAPGSMALSRGFVMVVLTIVAGALVMGVVARRAGLRRRADAIAALEAAADPSTTDADGPGTRHTPAGRPDPSDDLTDEEPTRG